MKTQQTLSSTDALEELIKRLLPEQANLQVDQLVFNPGELILLVTSTQLEGQCPMCEKATRRIHSRYWRTLEDLPWGASRLQLRVHLRRFFCTTPSCPRKIFTERLGPKASPSARRTSRLRDALLALGWAVGGEEGARQGMVHHMPIGASTLLSLMRRHGESASPTPRVLGVDDWSFQRDHPTGTILVDLEQHRPVDLLLGSDEQVLSDWLRSHRGVQIISRDRGAGYRKAIKRAAPQVKQVLDRWPVLKNLGEVIQKTLAQQIDVLRQAGKPGEEEHPADVLCSN
jgi:transposase